MKKTFFTLFFILLFIGTCFGGLKVGYISFSNQALSSFNNNFLNGLYLGLSSDETVVVQDNSQGVIKALENLYLFGADVIIGPLAAENVKTAKDTICNSGIVTILPFAKADYACSNLFTYNYNPIRASSELAKMLSSYQLGKILILYKDDTLDIAKKDAFLSDFKGSFSQLFVKSFEKSDKYSDVIRYIFGVRKIRRKSSLTTQEVFRHSFNIDSVIIFSSQRDFVNLANLMDYYNINPQYIFSTGIIVNNNLLSLNYSILKRIAFVTPYYLCSSDKVNSDFVKQYETEYQNEPGFMAALGYDIGRLLNGADRVSLQSRLKQTSDFDGLVGRLFFFDDNNVGFINYKFLTYKEVKKCKQEILNR